MRTATWAFVRGPCTRDRHGKPNFSDRPRCDNNPGRKMVGCNGITQRRSVKSL